MSESFDSVQWSACVHRLDLGFYSLIQIFEGMESEPMLTPREKSPLSDAQGSVEVARLHHAGQRAQHTTN